MKSLLIVALFISLLWAISPIMYKQILQTTDMYILIALQGMFYMLLYIVYWFVLQKHIKDNIFKTKSKNIWLIGLATCFTMMLPTILFFKLLQNNESYVVTALTYSSPMFTLIIAYLILGENVNWLSITGVLLVVIGIVFIAFAKSRMT